MALKRARDRASLTLLSGKLSDIRIVSNSATTKPNSSSLSLFSGKLSDPTAVSSSSSPTQPHTSALTFLCSKLSDLRAVSCSFITKPADASSVIMVEGFHARKLPKTDNLFMITKSSLHGSLQYDTQQRRKLNWAHGSILTLGSIIEQNPVGSVMLQRRERMSTGVEGTEKIEEDLKDHMKQEGSQGSPGSSSQGIGHKEMSAGLDGGPKYSVIRINNNGRWEHLELNSTELGVHPRDMDVLASNSFIPRRSTIRVRNDKVMIRMENVRAIIYRDHCILFDAYHPRKAIFKASRSADNMSKSQLRDGEAVQKAKEAFANSLAEFAREKEPSHLQRMPFHLRMLECLLDETCDFFRQKVERLKVVSDRMLEELTTDANMGGLQRLLPLKRVLTEVEYDIHDTHDAMEQVLNSDDMLQALCLELPTQFPWMDINSSANSCKLQQSLLRQAAGDILFTYLREVDDVGGVLEEMRKNMEAAQEVWELGLDTTRNRIIRSNLYISIATLSFSAATVPATFFGMNLINGLESHHKMFYYVVGAASASAFILGAGLFFVLRVWPTVADKRRAEDLTALRDLLDHIDDLDEIFRSVSKQGGSVTWKEFKQILKSRSSSSFIREKELELMFRMFDANRNGFLESEEWNSIMQKRLKDGSNAE